MACAVSRGIDISCQTKTGAIGGLKTVAYLGNVSDATFSESEDGYITGITFSDQYAGLYKFSTLKDGFLASDNIARTEDGLANYPHRVEMRLVDVTPQDREAIEDLAQADEIFAIVERASGVFEVFGLPLGLTAESGESSTGRTSTDSTVRNLILSGAQSALRKVFGVGTTEQNRAQLESYLASGS